MTALYIILGILLAFFLLSLLRLGVRVEFTGALAETRVTVIAGPARIQLLPKPEKQEKPRKEKKKKITVPKVGDTFQVGAGSIEFIGVGEGAQNNNDSSLCMRYDDGYHRFVFTGDAAESMEKKLNNVQCDVFQAGHHGSAYSNSDNLLSRMKASYVVVSCGKDNMYGHPHKEALQRFSKYNMQVYRTDELGTIRCVSKKNKLTFNGKEEIPTTQTTQYIGSRNTKKYHTEDCQYVKTISDKNKVYFSSSQEAQNEGYIPCKACNP